MARSLLIAVRFHEGRYHGQEDRFNGADGWPPSPARLYQALLAGAARGAQLDAADESALRWLEHLSPPRIAAPAARRGRAVKLFVPNNDLDSVGGDPARVSEIRVPKAWRPCFFDADQPLLYGWRFAGGSEDAARICVLARRLYQLGRGIDVAWADGHVLDSDKADAVLESHPGTLRSPGGPGEIPTPRPGTLDSLVARFERKRRRLATQGTGRMSGQLFTQPPKALFRHTGFDMPPRLLHFELRGTEGEFAPRPLAFVAPLTTGLRDAAARRLQQSFPAQSALFERLIIGRGAGPRDLAQRLRLVPVPSIGAQHSDSAIRRVVVEVPAECPIRVDDLKWAFSRLRPCDPQTGKFWPGRLLSTDDSRMAHRFKGPARAFRSITPVALSGALRHPVRAVGEKAAEERSREERRARGAVAQALRHSGVRAKPTEIHVQREPFRSRGVRAELFADGSRFSKHSLWHVALRFREAISGPLVLGDGRFYGLGLMEPVASYSDVVAYYLHAEYRAVSADRSALMHYLRRALMSLARDDSGHVDRLFSGHEPDGRTDSAGHHAHVFLAADGDTDRDDDAIARLVVAAPWAADRRTKPRRGDRRLFEQVTGQLTDLRAGRLGRFAGLSAAPIEAGDPLLGPSRSWISTTSYAATRNLKKRDDPSAVIKMDVTAECHRRGLPTPEAIGVRDVEAGPRGGRPSATLRLSFANVVHGPILLGRDSHLGGGLFHAVDVGER